MVYSHPKVQSDRSEYTFPFGDRNLWNSCNAVRTRRRNTNRAALTLFDYRIFIIPKSDLSKIVINVGVEDYYSDNFVVAS